MFDKVNRMFKFKKFTLLLMFVVLLSICFPVIAHAAPGQTAKPKIMIIILEKVAGVFGTTGFEQPNQAELTLMQKFNELGFTVVDPAMVKRNLIQSKGLRLLEGDDRAAAAVGLQHGADISIIGSAISKPAGSKLFGTQMQSIQATLTARVVRNSDARVIAQGSASATQPHIDEVQGGVIAIEKAATELAENLGAQVEAKWQAQQKRGATQVVTVLITGLVSFRHLDFILSFFEKKVKGIKTTQLRSFTEGVAELGLDYRGGIRKLARQIARKKFSGFRLEPTSVTSNRMDLVVVLDK